MPTSAESRREFVKRVAYVAPAILTLTAAPSFAKTGSEKQDRDETGSEKQKRDKPPKKD